MSNFSRRQAISLGAVGAAGIAAAVTQGKKAQAQTEPLSQPEVNPDGKFADKVVLINVLKTNVTGYFLSMKYEMPHLLKNEPWGKYGTKGVIVNNSSVSGHIGFPGISPYSSSKHAIIGMTKCAALEYGGQGIRINSISPGAVNTPMRRQAYENQGLSPNEPLPAPPNIVNRANTPEEMADIVMLLASTDVSYVLGTDIDVTTGMLTGLLTV